MSHLLFSYYSPKRHFLPSAILAFFLILIYSPSIAFAQEKIAVISKFNGEVKVVHEGKELIVEQIGNRIKNSSIYNKDSIITMPGANADIVFLDNSRVEVRENTTLSIITEQLAEKDKIAQKETLRNVKLKAGNLWASVTPSTSILTEFETPSGVASVRGTEIGVGFDPVTGAASIDLGDGIVFFVMPGEQMSIDLTAGDAITVSVDPVTGTASITVDTGEVTITDKATGQETTAKAGESVNVQVPVGEPEAEAEPEAEPEPEPEPTPEQPAKEEDLAGKPEEPESASPST